MGVAALVNLGFFGAEAFLPLSLTSLHHRSVTEAGVVLTVAALTWTAGSWVQARYVAVVGPRRLCTVGLALVAVGVAGVGTLDWSSTPWWVGFVAWGVAGAGMGLSYATTTLVVLSSAGPGARVGRSPPCRCSSPWAWPSASGVGGAALALSIALGHGRAPGLRALDAAAVVATLVGLGLTVTVPRIVPGRGYGRRSGGAAGHMVETAPMKTSLLNGAQWAAVLRIGLGLWWLESFRHKNLEAWIKRQAGINWAADIAAKHKFAVVGRGFDAVVKPHPEGHDLGDLDERALARAGAHPGLPDAGGRLRQHRPQPPLLRAHDPRLGRAGTEPDDGPRRRGDPRSARVAGLVDRPPHRHLLTRLVAASAGGGTGARVTARGTRMPIGIGEDHEELRRTVRRWVETRCPRRSPGPCSTPRPRAARASGTSWPARAGSGSTWPRSTGGQGFGLMELAVVVEELARAAAPGPVVPTMLAAAVLAGSSDPADGKELPARPGRREPARRRGALPGSGSLAAAIGDRRTADPHRTVRPVLAAGAGARLAPRRRPTDPDGPASDRSGAPSTSTPPGSPSSRWPAWT